MLKRFYSFTLVLLCSLMTAWASEVTVSPTLDVNFRTASGNTAWQTVKNAADEGNNDFELTYTAGFFALQKYTVADLQNVTKLVITLTVGSKSGVDAVKMWPIANNTWTAESGVDDIVPLVTNAVGVAPRATEGSVNTPPIAGKKVTGSDPAQATFTISGDALTAIKANAASDGTFTLLLTNNDLLNSGNKRSYLSNNTANAAASRPTMTATVESAGGFAVTNTTTGQGYKTLNEAFDALSGDANIVLNDNSNITARCTLKGAYTVNVTAAKDVTLTGPKNAMWFLANVDGAVLNIGDANHTITLNGRSETNEQTASVVKYEKKSNVSVTNVKFQNFRLAVNGTAIPGLFETANSDGVFTLENITMSGCTAAEGGALIRKTRVTNDRVVLKGFLNVESDCTGPVFYLNSETKSSGTTGRIKVDDSNFSAAHTLSIEWAGTKADGIVVVIGTTATNAGKFALTDSEWTLERKSNGDLYMAKPATPTVKIGDKTYPDLATAVSAAADGDVLTLLADQEISARIDVKEKGITIKGDGKTIKRATGYKGILMLTANGETPAALTLENVTIDGQNVEATGAIVEAGNKGTTTLKDVTIKNENTTANASIVNKGGGKLVLQGTVSIPSIFVGKGLFITATGATASSPITLVTDNGYAFGLLVEGGVANQFSCSTFRLSQQQDGVYAMPLPVTNAYTHPALLHTSADIEAVKKKLTSDDAMYNAAYNRLEAQSGGQAAGAVEYLKRMDKGNWESTYPDYSNFSRAATDAKLAYQLALRYQLKGSDAAATAAVAILNDWATNNKGFLRVARKADGTTYANSIPDPNEYLVTIQAYQFANAAELLRNYSGWQAADFQKFQNWIRQTFADVAILFLENHHNNKNALHYWLNWDLAALNAMLSVGILCDDKALVDYALAYPTSGAGTGQVNNAIVATHQDPDSDETLAQCQESGRDQGHSTLDVTLLGVLCQTAQNIGTDLWTAYKALEMAEYVGKYNLKNADGSFVYAADKVPFTAYSNGEVDHTAISADGRGTERPCWELFHAYAKKNTKADAYTEAWVKFWRAKNNYGEGEATSTDELGFGTLMFGAEVSATGIQTLKANQSAQDGVYYNLQGQRVDNPAKGLYIVNGKKVIVK